MNDELKPGETRIYDNEGMPVGYGGGGGGTNHNDREFYESIKRRYKHKQQIIKTNESVSLEAANEIKRLRKALNFAVQALEYYQNPHDRAQAVPDFYSELGFGDEAEDTLDKINKLLNS